MSFPEVAAGCFVGVDMGGTHLRVAIADEAGKIRAQRRITTEGHLGPDNVIDRMADCISDAVESVSDLQTICCTAVGLPGLVDGPSGMVRFLPNLPTQWRDVPMASMLREKLGSEVRLMNDARMATLGEWRFGHGSAYDDGSMVFLTIGTGVGGGVVVDGQLRLGPTGSAGEIGHQTVCPDGPTCGCGNRGCLEAVASGPAIVAAAIKELREDSASELMIDLDANPSTLHPGQIAEAASMFPAMQKVLEDAFRWIGIGLANAITILHPDLVVIGGGVATIEWDWESVVRREVQRRVRMFDFDVDRIVRSRLGDDAGLRGALALAMQ